MPKKSVADLEDNNGNTPIFIRAYGEFWRQDLVNWEKIGPKEKRYRLLGLDSHGKTIDVYEQRGVYVLYQDYEPVYVGMADKSSIGWRIQLHRESKKRVLDGTAFPGLGSEQLIRAEACASPVFTLTRRRLN